MRRAREISLFFFKGEGGITKDSWGNCFSSYLFFSPFLAIIAVFLPFPRSLLVPLFHSSSSPGPSPSSRRGVSDLRHPPPFPCSLPPPGLAWKLQAAAPQEDVSQGVSPATLARATAWSEEAGCGVRRPPGAHRAAVRCREGDHPGHLGARVQEL